MKRANGDGTKKGNNDKNRRIWWRNRVKRIDASLRPQRPPKGAAWQLYDTVYNIINSVR